MEESAGIRIDKWLWAARFFKTRTLAAQAAAGGKVKLNGARVKPATAVRPGDELTVHVGAYEYAVRVEALATRRGPAPDAARLYKEYAESIAARAALAAQRRAERLGFVPAPSRPGKHDRRRIIRLKQRDDRR